MAKADRPLLVTIIATLNLLIALLLILAGAALLAGVSFEMVDLDADLKWLLDMGGYAVIVAGLITLIISVGFFRGWSLWWYLGVIFGILAVIIDIVTIVFGGYPLLIVLIIHVIILWYLFKDNVKAFFLD